MNPTSTTSWPGRALCAAVAALLTGLLLLPLTARSGSDIPAGIGKALGTHDIPLADVSLYVQRLTADAPTLTLNERVPRSPASVLKLLTSAVALDLLGPDFRWRTEAYVEGTLRDGVLSGDLVLKGYGDPFLTPERFWQLLHGLQERGLRMIEGDMIVDGSHFAAATGRRGDFDGKPWRAYNALPHALSLNFQTTHLHLVADRPRGRVRSFTYPPLANLQILNRVKLVSGPCQQQHLNPKVSVSEREGGATLTLDGSYSDDCPEWSNSYLVMDPALHIGGAFRALWNQMGGQLKGTVKPGSVSKAARLFHSIESPPLAEVIRGMNKYSNNLMSRLVLLTAAAETRGPPATAAQGEKLVTDWLESRHLPSAEVRVSNGSGLARDARLSAQTLGRLLVTAFDSPIMPEFMASLPIAGTDGTMRRRLRNTDLAGRAHIKTGSLDDVSSMAGYVQDRHNRRWVVVLLINHPGLQPWQGKQVQDALLRWTYQGPELRPGGRGKLADESTSECKDQRQSHLRSEEAPGSALSSAHADADETSLPLTTASIGTPSDRRDALVHLRPIIATFR